MSDDEIPGDGPGVLAATARDLLTFVLDRAPVRLFEVDTEGVFLMNEGVNPTPGVGPGSLVGVSAFVAYRDFPEGLAALRQALTGQKSEVRYTQDDRVFDLKLTPRRDEHGVIVSVLGMALVVTERVHAEQEAKKNEERFRRVVESNMIGLTFYERTGEIPYANDAALEILGYTREDLVAGGLNWRTNSVPDYAEADERAFVEMTASGRCTPFEKEFLRKDGSRVPVLFGGALLNEAGGTRVAFLLDLSERRRSQEERERLQAQLLQVQKLESLGVLAGGIAHDSTTC